MGPAVSSPNYQQLGFNKKNKIEKEMSCKYLLAMFSLLKELHLAINGKNCPP